MSLSSYLLVFFLLSNLVLLVPLTDLHNMMQYPLVFFQSHFVGIHHVFVATKSCSEHEECGLRHVEVGEHSVSHREIVGSCPHASVGFPLDIAIFAL